MFRFVATTLALLMAVSLAVGQARADDVYFLTTSNSSENLAVENLLAARGITVTVGPNYTTFAGPVPAGTNAVVLLGNDSSTGAPMTTGGQNALLSFIKSGGGLVTGEWTIWGNAHEGYDPILAPVFPVVPSSLYNYNSPITYSQATANAVLDSGLPSSFTFTADSNGGTETYFQPKVGATVYFNSSYGSGVIGWKYGSGRVISLSTLAGTTELGDPHYARLFGNSANWAAGVVPAPSTYLGLLSLGGTGILGYIWRRRRRS